MPEGQIIKALSGYYYVQEKGSAKQWRCRARGVFKKKGIHPLVGDYVLFEPSATSEGTLTQVLERKNELVRPPIANVDQAFVVFSIDKPGLSTQLLDRFLVHIEKASIEPVICLSKIDLREEREIRHDFPQVEEYKKMGYTLFLSSSITQEGIALATDLLKDKTTVLAGPSGVGKSSLLNTLNPSLTLETKQVSHRLGRGRHTTRHVELVPLPQGGLVADTPGFSQLDFQQMDPEELGTWFREFVEIIPHCKFRGCLHENEPECAVKQAVEEGGITRQRYVHYVQFLKEIKEQYRKRYC